MSVIQPIIPVAQSGGWQYNNACQPVGDIVLPDGTTNVAAYAFYGCRAITSLTMPLTLTTINTHGLQDMRIPHFALGEGVTTIGTYALADHTTMTKIYFPACLASVGNNAFANCPNITDVYFGGTQAQWSAITMGTGNTVLTNATIHYEASPEDMEE